MAVKKGLKKPGLHFIIHDMGVVDVLEKTTSKKRELINNIKAMLIGKVKNVIIEMVHHKDEFPNSLFSKYISKKTGCNYHISL